MARKSPEVRRAARQAYSEARHETAPGEGRRFAAVTKSAAAGGARNPEAVAAAIGRKKYGAKRMASMARAGRRK